MVEKLNNRKNLLCDVTWKCLVVKLNGICYMVNVYLGERWPCRGFGEIVVKFFLKVVILRFLTFSFKIWELKTQTYLKFYKIRLKLFKINIFL